MTSRCPVSLAIVQLRESTPPHGAGIDLFQLSRPVRLLPDKHVHLSLLAEKWLKVEVCNLGQLKRMGFTSGLVNYQLTVPGRVQLVYARDLPTPKWSETCFSTYFLDCWVFSMNGS